MDTPAGQPGSQSGLLHRRAAGWFVWLWWTMVSAAGWGIGAFLGMVPEMFIGQSLWPLGGGIEGAVIGTAQWLVLRGRFRGAGWWVLASAAAYELVMFTGAILVIGPVISTAQMFVLLQSRELWVAPGGHKVSLWWLVSAVAGTVCFILGEEAGFTIFGATFDNTLVGFVLPVSAGMAVGGALYGLLTGPVLTRLLREETPASSRR